MHMKLVKFKGFYRETLSDDEKIFSVLLNIIKHHLVLEKTKRLC